MGTAKIRCLQTLGFLIPSASWHGARQLTHEVVALLEVETELAAALGGIGSVEQPPPERPPPEQPPPERPAPERPAPERPSERPAPERPAPPPPAEPSPAEPPPSLEPPSLEPPPLAESESSRIDSSHRCSLSTSYSAGAVRSRNF